MKCLNFFAALNLLFLATGFAGEHATSDAQKHHSLDESAKKIDSSKCSAHDFSSLSAPFLKKSGERTYSGPNSPFPLLEQTLTSTEVDKPYSAGVGHGGSYKVSIYSGSYLTLSSRAYQNFATLLTHAFECKEKNANIFINCSPYKIKYYSFVTFNNGF